MTKEEEQHLRDSWNQGPFPLPKEIQDKQIAQMRGGEDKELKKIMERVHLLEVNCNMYFDNVQFYNEVANPRLCTMIDDIF